MSQRYTLYTAKDALQPQPPIQWIIENVFTPGSVTLVYGKQGSKKTWLMIDAVVSVALGDPWLGYPTRQSNTLIIDEESGKRRLGRRLTQVLHGHNGDENTPIFYTALEAFDLQKKAEIKHVKDLIAGTDAKLIFIDALMDVMPGADENAVGDVSPIFHALRSIAEDTDSAIIMIHHAAKGTGDYRGSTGISAAVDVIMKVEALPKSSIVNIYMEKTRDTEEFQFSAKFEYTDDAVTWSSMAAPAPGMSKKLTPAQVYVIGFLRDHGPQDTNTVEANTQGCTPATARKEIYNLEKMGLLEKIKSGNGGQGSKSVWAVTLQGLVNMPDYIPGFPDGVLY
jgi:DNA-binding MarR family transcriptional regulator